MLDPDTLPEASEAGAALTELMLETFRLNGRLVALGDRMTSVIGLSTARWQVLGAVNEGAFTVSQIARNMGLRRQSVQRTVDLLTREGLLELAPNPHHQRAKLVHLTVSGEAKLHDVFTGHITFTNELGAEFSARDLRMAVQAMRSLRDRIEKDEP